MKYFSSGQFTALLKKIIQKYEVGMSIIGPNCNQPQKTDF